MKQYQFVLFFALVVLSGCAAHMVVRPGSKSASQYAPVNESTRPGIMKYSNQGARPVREARRRNAYKQMHDACNGDYKILSEGPRSEGGVIVPVGYGAITDDSQYLYIQFECVTSK